MKLIYIAQALDYLTPPLKFEDKCPYIVESETEIIYVEGFTPLDYNEVISKAREFEIENDSTKYQRDRLSEYNKLNQDELRYDDIINGTNTWIEAIKAIKDKYPKPS